MGSILKSDKNLFRSLFSNIQAIPLAKSSTSDNFVILYYHEVDDLKSCNHKSTKCNSCSGINSACTNFS